MPSLDSSYNRRDLPHKKIQFVVVGTVTKMDRLLWICTLACLMAGSNGLKITNFHVPSYSWNTAHFDCQYDLENEKLFAAKWYHNNAEFFRCQADGSVMNFKTNGITVSHIHNSQKGSCSFELAGLTPWNNGEYTCEISLEYPTFHILRKSANLTVIQPPEAPELLTTEATLAPLTQVQDLEIMTMSPASSYNTSIVFIISYSIFIIINKFI